MLEKDLTPNEWAVGEENINCILTEQEMDEAKANTAYPDEVS